MQPRSTNLRSSRLIAVVGWTVIASGAAFVVIRTINSEPPARSDLESGLAAFAFGVAIASPGVMALLARHDRPALVLPAAMVLVPFSFLSFAGVLLPLLIPAVLLMRIYARHRRTREGWLDAGVTASLITVSICSIAVLLMDTRERTFTTPNSVHSTSIPSYLASTTSIALVVGGLRLAWWATTPRGDPRLRRSAPRPRASRPSR